MQHPGFVVFLRESLRDLERDRPDVAARLAATLAALDVSIAVGDESIVLRSDGEALLLEDPARPARVEVATERTTLLALLDGDLALVDAVLAGRVRLRGEAPDLARFHDALWLYLQGAVRVPSFAALLQKYRSPL